MNRIEFMTELAALLQDVSVEERREAMKYYNNYFDDAGTENEGQVIAELESPGKVAATIKADMESDDQSHGEFTETGYTDDRFEQKEAPASRSGYQYETGKEGAGAPRTSKVLKVLLIIGIVVLGIPVIIPVVFAVIAVVFGFVITAFAIVFSIVLGFAAIAITGICVLCVGIATLVPEVAVGLALIGTGLILAVIGVVGTVAGVKLCAVAIPGMCRGIVWVCRKPFQRKAVV